MFQAAKPPIRKRKVVQYLLEMMDITFPEHYKILKEQLQIRINTDASLLSTGEIQPALVLFKMDS
ncbi:protein of unknown function [Candidatus Nitrosacidococcus tergens]|uniref:Uncharacterized protein n=1 Tax=Candidatus Nitrosacidococcus tergens TaxID=553981 RepID=A0A7G1QBN8_9GAMM|nr:protein of unknown function [Candidatus Nitrosacidococcus tergens]